MTQSRAYTGPASPDILIIGGFGYIDDQYTGRCFSTPIVAHNLALCARGLGSVVSALGLTYLMTERLSLHNEDISGSNLFSDRKTCPGPDWEFDADSQIWIKQPLAKNRDEIQSLIKELSPKLIITCGDLALWAVTGKVGASKWRGSRLQLANLPCPVVPTLDLHITQRQSDQILYLKADFMRAGAVYRGEQLPRNYKFIIKPDFETVMAVLFSLLEKADTSPEVVRLSGDLETRLYHIACFGIAWSPEEAICIPFTWLDTDHFPWTVEQETSIVKVITLLFNHPNILWVGQNFLYDCQYFIRYWGTYPRRVFDTMIGHHAIHPHTRKGLDVLSSIYAQDHVYWKDEGKIWDPTIGETQYWGYNCKDACITFEIVDPILEQQEHYSANDTLLRDFYSFQQSLFFPLLRMTMRGINRNEAARQKFALSLRDDEISRQEDLNFIAGHPLNPRSPKQLSAFLYDDLGIPGVKNLTGDSLTTNSPAISIISERVPALRRLCQLIVELRSIGVFQGTFIEAKADIDGRMRSAFNIGPETFRFNSRENAFGTGMNFQNIPVKEKKKLAHTENYIKLPNIRKLFIPDPGFVFFDMDLDRADLQVVIWEADDKDMKKALHLGLDMHCINACDIFNIKGIPYEELTETHPNYLDHRGKIGEDNRGKAKAGVHATNYGVGDRKLAIALGITVQEAYLFRKNWFERHPGILRWHKRTEQHGMQRGYISNAFGARRYTVGSFNLPEALGWIPQSTVAIVINKAFVAIDTAQQEGRIAVEVLIQVHDSLAGQFPSNLIEPSVKDLLTLSEVVIPYDDPLIIPRSVNYSLLSWGDCK